MQSKWELYLEEVWDKATEVESILKNRLAALSSDFSASGLSFPATGEQLKKLREIEEVQVMLRRLESISED